MRNKGFTLIELMIVVAIIAIIAAIAIPSLLRSRMAANATAAAAACKAFAEAEEIYHRTDYDADGVLEYATKMSGATSLLTNGGTEIALIDRAFAAAEGPGSSSPKAGYSNDTDHPDRPPLHERHESDSGLRHERRAGRLRQHWPRQLHDQQLGHDLSVRSGLRHLAPDVVQPGRPDLDSDGISCQPFVEIKGGLRAALSFLMHIEVTILGFGLTKSVNEFHNYLYDKSGWIRTYQIAASRCNLWAYLCALLSNVTCFFRNKCISWG